MLLTIELDDQRFALRIHGRSPCHGLFGQQFIGVRRRDEAFDMDPLGRFAHCQQRALHGVHERSRPTDEVVAAGRSAQQMTDLMVRQKTLHRIEDVHHVQLIRMRLDQLAQLVLENHRRLIAVGVDQLDRSPTAVQHRFENGKHRGDARAAPEQDQGLFGVRLRVQAEMPGRWQHFQPVADLHFVHPVRHPATVDPFHRDLGQRVREGRAGHGVAAGQQFAGQGHAKTQELARFVAKALTQGWRYVQHQRARIQGLVDHRAHLQ
ncbi:hypothetical protein D3C81_951000 [compost metagenome]